MPNKQKIPILDAFRFICSALVVLVHYEIIFGQFLIYGAFATTAVSWFFVVSGFILSYTYPQLQGAADYKRFYLHRFVRIYPVYFLAVIFSALFVVYGMSVMGEAFFAEIRRPIQISYDLPEEKSSGFLLSSTLRYLSFTQSIGGMETLKFLFNGPLWSLVLEVYFYICFPLLILLLKPVNSLKRVLLAFAFGYGLQFVLILLFLPDAEQYDVMNLNVPVYTNPLIRCIEFIFGMLLYKAFSFGEISLNNIRRRVAVVVTISLYLVSIYVGENYVPYQYSSFFLSVPAVTIMIYALLELRWYPQQKMVKFCSLLGALSYVLYCFHWPLMELLRYSRLLPESLPLTLHVLLLMSILMVFCYLLYRLIETPARRLLFHYFENKPASGS